MTIDLHRLDDTVVPDRWAEIRHRAERPALTQSPTGPPDGRSRLALAAAIAAGIAVLVGSTALLVRESADVVDVASGPTIGEADGASAGYFEIGGDDPILVSVGIVAEVGPADIYAGLSGPEPIFDVSAFGQEFSLRSIPPEQFVVPLDRDGTGSGSALATNEIVLLGEVDGAQLALHTFDNNACLYLGNFTTVTGGGSCDPTNGEPIHMMGFDYQDPPIGSWSAVVGVPAGTSVVVVEWSNGESNWQRPTASTAFFLHDTAIAAQRFVFLDAAGQQLG